MDLHRGEAGALQLIHQVNGQLLGTKRDVGRWVGLTQQAAPLEGEQRAGYGGQCCQVRFRRRGLWRSYWVAIIPHNHSSHAIG